jgi:hypothetical protein
MRVSGQTQRPGPSTPGKETWYPLYKKLGETQGRWGRAREISPPLWLDPRTLQPVAIRYRKRSKVNAPCILGWPYTEGTWLYCDYSIWCVPCTVVVWTCSAMCGCFDNCVRACVCVYLVICVLVFTVFCIVCTVFLYCFVYVYLLLFVLSVLV